MRHEVPSLVEGFKDVVRSCRNMDLLTSQLFWIAGVQMHSNKISLVIFVPSNLGKQKIRACRPQIFFF